MFESMNKLIVFCISLTTSISLSAQTVVKEPLHTLSGIVNDVHVLSGSHTGGYIAAGTWDKQIVIYKNDSSLKLHKTLSRHMAPITSICFSRDGRLMASGASDKTIIVWDSVFNFKKSFEGHSGKVNALLFDPSKRFLISGGDDRQILLWSIEKGTVVKKVDNQFAVHSFAQSNDLRSLYVAGNEPVIKVYTIGTWQITKTFLGHTDIVNDIDISSNGQYMISGSNDKTARIWDLKTGKEIRKLGVECWKIQAVAFSRDSKYAATGCNDGNIKIWEVETGKLITHIESTGENIKDLFFSKFGNQILSAALLRGKTDFGIRVWPTAIVVANLSTPSSKMDSVQTSTKQLVKPIAKPKTSGK
jgi:WD40 repeat protein